MQYIFLLHWKEHVIFPPEWLKNLNTCDSGLLEVLWCPLYVKSKANICESFFSVGGEKKSVLVFLMPESSLLFTQLGSITIPYCEIAKYCQMCYFCFIHGNASSASILD